MQKICFIVCLFFFSTLFSNVHAQDLSVRHSAGGQASALAVGDIYWYQAIGERLLILKKNGGEKVGELQLASRAGGICTDLLLDGTLLYAVLDGSEVVVLDISTSRSPKIVNRMRAEDLGIRPREFAIVAGSPVVYGDGGAVRLQDASSLVSCEGVVTGVSNTLGNGVVYAKERKLFDSATNTFLGSASEVFALSEQANAPIGTLLYVRSLKGSTEVGLMTSDLKEFGSTLGKVLLQGEYTDVLVRGSRAYVVTDAGLYVLGVSPKELRLLREFPLEGVRSVDIVASNYFALCGDFGYGLYRIENDSGGVGRTLFRVVPANGAMRAGFFDGRGVQIETDAGSLYYSFEGELSHCYSDHTSHFMQAVRVPTSAVVLGGEAEIEQDGTVTVHTSKGDMQVVLPSPATTVVAVSGDFWFGTENGIYVVGQGKEEPLLVGLQLAGPIVQLIPLLDGSVGFVSGAGVVGVVDMH